MEENSATRHPKEQNRVRTLKQLRTDLVRNLVESVVDVGMPEAVAFG